LYSSPTIRAIKSRIVRWKRCKTQTKFWSENLKRHVGNPITSIGHVPRVTDGGSHQICCGGPNSYGNKEPWTNRKGNEMGQPQQLAHPRERSPLPLLSPRSH